MPDSLLTLLTAVNRADCIDFMESNMKAEVSNRLGGRSEMKQLTADYILLQTTPQSTWQMKLLLCEGSEEKLICCISTVKAPAADSHIRFYTTDWKELPTAYYLSLRPDIDRFLVEKTDSTGWYAYQDARRKADINLLRADLSPESDTLTLTWTTPDYMEQEAAETLKPYQGPTIVYHWNGKRFVPAP